MRRYWAAVSVMMFITVAVMCGCVSPGGSDSDRAASPTSAVPSIRASVVERHLGDGQRSPLTREQRGKVEVGIVSCGDGTATVAVTNRNEFPVDLSLAIAPREVFLYTMFASWDDWPVEIANLQPSATQMWEEDVLDTPGPLLCPERLADPCSCLGTLHFGVHSEP